MTTRVRSAPGGGRVVEIAPERLVGWVVRFAERNGGAAEPTWTGEAEPAVLLTAGNGTRAVIRAPFGPVRPAVTAEPLEGLLDHLAGLGVLAVVAVRAGAHTVGLVENGRVLRSRTDTHYVQGRTAAGGWSQQRYARRRDNQHTAAWQRTSDDAADVLLPTSGGQAPTARGLVLAGDVGALNEVMNDRRLTALADLPRRTFTDIVEPRRSVLDELAVRALTLEITLTDPD